LVAFAVPRTAALGGPLGFAIPHGAAVLAALMGLLLGKEYRNALGSVRGLLFGGLAVFLAGAGVMALAYL
jgi:hypothetical protein